MALLTGLDCMWSGHTREPVVALETSLWFRVRPKQRTGGLPVLKNAGPATLDEGPALWVLCTFFFFFFFPTSLRQSLQNWEHSALPITTDSAAKTYFPSVSDRGFCLNRERKRDDLLSE